MASFLQRVFSGVTGDFKGAFRTNDTVKIEKDPNDPDREILRFGNGKDDYFQVEGTRTEKERLREILSKVVESPTMLKKIRDMPLEDRPLLVQASAISGGQICGGYCNGEVISMSAISGTGYTAAAIFCHEFQHQYQFVKGDPNAHIIKGEGVSLPDYMLERRIAEATADVAAYQYMYEIKDLNPQTKIAYAEAMGLGVGQRAYSKAKNENKPEWDCVLAGMKGYADDLVTAKFYEKHYCDTYMHRISADDYAFNVRSSVAKQEAAAAKSVFNGKIDVLKSFENQAVGLTSEPFSEHKVKRFLHSPDFSYVTPHLARFVNDRAKRYEELTGEKKDVGDLWIKTAYGLTRNREKSGLAGLMFKAKTKFKSAVETIKKSLSPAKEEIGARKNYYDRGKTDLNVLFDKDGQLLSSVKYQADYGFEKEIDARKRIGEKETNKRTAKAEKMFAILMKDGDMRKKMAGLGKQGVTLAFYDGIGKPVVKDGAILLDPAMKPKELAACFAWGVNTVIRERAEKQAESKTVDAKPAEKQPASQTAEAKTESKSAETQPKLQMRGEALLKMVDQMTASIADSKKSTTAYQPTDQEAKTVADLAKLTENAAKGAATPEQANAARAKALGEYAQTAEGMKNVTFLMQSYGRMLSQTPEKLQAHMRERSGQSLMGELNKQQAKNNAAQAARQAARAAGFTAQR